MKLILAISDERGYAFNKRRQSRDRNMISFVCDVLSGAKIRIKEYSLPLFEGFTLRGLSVHDEDFLSEAGDDDYCFVEVEDDFLNYKEDISEIILFKWNRKYPSDKFLPEIEELHPDFKMVETMDFQGNSHDIITLEVWSR